MSSSEAEQEPNFSYFGGAPHWKEAAIAFAPRNEPGMSSRLVVQNVRVAEGGVFYEKDGVTRFRPLEGIHSIDGEVA